MDHARGACGERPSARGGKASLKVVVQPFSYHIDFVCLYLKQSRRRTVPLVGKFFTVERSFLVEVAFDEL